MIETTQTGDMAWVTINRPDKANALTEEMLDQIAQAVESCTAKVLVLTGKGKVFSAGADLDAARAGLATSPVWERVSGSIAAFPGLSIAALNGTVAGGACGMVLACDLRIAAEGAKLFYPVMKLGFLPQPSDPLRLTALIGPAKAKLILVAGAKFTTEEAQDCGLFDRVTAPDALHETVETLAADCLAADMSHVAAIKQMIHV